MENTNRIDPQEVLVAFKTTSFQPLEGEYFNYLVDDVSCACGMGALYALRHSLTPSLSSKVLTLNTDVEKYMVERYGDDYKCGFAIGFDGIPLEETSPRKTEGYEDGHLTRKLCVQAGIL